MNCPGCPPPYEYSPTSPQDCLCAAPLLVGYRLKSPGFSDFRPYVNMFEQHLAYHLKILPYQLYLHSFAWESGPRVRMFLKLFPAYINNSFTFNRSEVRRIMDTFTTHGIHDDDLFGPCEVMNITLSSVYIDGLSRNLIWCSLRQSFVEVRINAYLPVEESRTFISNFYNVYLEILYTWYIKLGM